MDFGFTPDQAAGAAEQVNSAVGPTVWLILIVAVAGIGKLIFIAWGDKMNPSGLLANFSGWGLVGVAALFLVGGMFMSDREVRAWVQLRQTFVDPVMVNVLGMDSCNPVRNKFCVVTWEEDGRELVVNWHDKRVTAFDVFGGYEFTLYDSLRPLARPETLSAVDPKAHDTAVEG